MQMVWELFLLPPSQLFLVEPSDGFFVRVRAPFGLVQRRFAEDDTLVTLCSWLECCDELVSARWTLSTVAPSRVVARMGLNGIQCDDDKETLAALGLRNATLVCVIDDSDD